MLGISCPCSTLCPNAMELKAIAWRVCGGGLLDSPERDTGMEGD